MTLTELKTLKVGQVVKYTNDVDALNVEYYKIHDTTDTYIEFRPLSNLGWYVLHFGQQNINHIASMLTIDQPTCHVV